MPYKDHLEDLIALAMQAGKATLPYFRQITTTVHHKNDGSPVTIADQTSEDIILDGLRRLTPDIPIIAEEEAEAGLAPKVTLNDTFWLVDPLDGTKEFIKGSPDYTVNIGLIHKGKPVFGVVYLPATGELYHGGQMIGAFKNKRAITVKLLDKADGIMMVGTPNYTHSEKRREFVKHYTIKDYVTRGSSLKFCLVAEGLADLYPRFVPTYEWDTAAAHAILLEAGGDIVDITTGQRLQYAKANNFYLNGDLVTGSDMMLNDLLMNKA